MVSPARDPLPPDCRARQHGGLARSRSSTSANSTVATLIAPLPVIHRHPRLAGGAFIILTFIIHSVAAR